MVEGARLSKEYRVYVIGRDGHIVSRMDLRCLDEEEATQKAVAKHGPRQCRAVAGRPPD